MSAKSLPRASLPASVRLAAQVMAPPLLQGVILRRRSGVWLAALADADGRATRLLRRMRARYGDGPLVVPLPGRGPLILPLAAADVERVLADPAHHPATREKTGALAHFQPDGVLATRDPGLRARRRAFNERVLAASDPGVLGEIARQELRTLPRYGRLTWDAFSAVHWRIARRVVLGDGARDDEALTWMLNRLRGDANWSYLRGHRTDVRSRFERRLRTHLERAEPGSLAARAAATPADPELHAEGQVPHWLFAMDAVGIAAYRALALLAAHPGAPIRESVLESVRLWPTTPIILRTAPDGATVAVHVPYVNREAGGDRFAPGAPTGVPFSAGHAACPGRDLATELATAELTELLRERQFAGPRLPAVLPGSLDHFALTFAVRQAGR
ncbi:hypothetical protein [Nonomuraea sp. NPDC050310]|uniref:hypothetical protein n=1 Tax=Nonomuraea sp. NPDC050310 TaxID=3154935 RepID=UPI0033BFBDCB